MKRNIFSAQFFIFVFMSGYLFSLPSPACSSDIDSRDAIIEKKLNCVAQNFNADKDFNWVDVCYTDTVSSATENTSTDSDFLKTQDETVHTGSDSRYLNENPNKFELGTEVYYYKYTERIGVKVSGLKNGIVGAYTYHFSENLPIDQWYGFFNKTHKINVFRLEGRVSYGAVEYEGSGSWNDIPDWNFETRAFLGYDIPISEDFRVTPMLGVGYRYLFNESSDIPANAIYLSGYDRESNYIYIPLGIDCEKKLNELWSVLLKNEFDFFIWGKQISHNENQVDVNGFNIGEDQLDNVQDRGGYGWRSSVRLLHKSENFDIFFEPFVRYWHIRDSQWEDITSRGVSTGYIGQEPDNKTWEYGLNMGANF